MIKQTFKFTKSAMASTMMLFLFSTLTLSAQVGIYTVNGNMTLSSTSTTSIQLVDLTGAGTGHDQIATTGNSTIDGTLQIILDGYSPSPNDQFEIMDIAGTQSGTYSSIIWPASMSTWSIDYGVLNPGKVTIYGPSSPLPVELISFEVTVKDNHNLLSWKTASELNNDYFEVEHSDDGRSFYSIGTVKGGGNSLDIRTYSYTHHHARIGTSYYRLKQVDFDGKFSVSDIRSVHRTGNSTGVTLYPNPSTGVVYLSFPSNHVKVYDTTGKILMDISDQVEQIDLSDLIPGLYYIEIDGSKNKKAITITK